MVRQVLLPVRALITDKLNCIELLEPQLRDRNRVKYVANGYPAWHGVYTASPVGGAALLIWIVRQGQKELQVTFAYKPPKPEKVCPCGLDAAMLERLSGDFSSPARVYPSRE